MMDFDDAVLIKDFFLNHLDIFTSDEFYHILKNQGVKISKEEATSVLASSDMVFSLVNNEYITRAGVFVGRWFSFKPSAEEIQKGHIILGHRCIPFTNPETPPDEIKVYNGKYIVSPEAVSFSMNLALDTFALFGEGYVLPCIFNDHSNTKLPLSSVQYGMPSEIELTAWPISKISGGQGIKAGDRILARVIDWGDNLVELTVLPANSSYELTQEDIEREEWYINFEKGLIENFETCGPGASIESQLAFLFLENQETLCKRSCGSAEEFLKHTKKIGFSPYGVESRIWYVNTPVPYIGNWNKDYTSEALFTNMTLVLSPQIIDAYIINYLYEQREMKSQKTLESLVDDIFPPSLKMTAGEHRAVLLNIEKRRDILNKKYNQFADYEMAPVRKRFLDLFSQVGYLLCSIGCSGLKLQDFPQQELVILVQLYSHIARIAEEMEIDPFNDTFPYDEVLLSLDGMEETFEDIGDILRDSLDAITYDSIKIVHGE